MLIQEVKGPVGPPLLVGDPSGVIIVHFGHYGAMILIKFHVADIIAKYEC